MKLMVIIPTPEHSSKKPTTEILDDIGRSTAGMTIGISYLMANLGLPTGNSAGFTTLPSLNSETNTTFWFSH
ncbi:MAG TPA: hypothetical protein EYG38_11775 [Verrucomicrobia bacterium]|nr:hypothetical protein [Verrucomicrobiota bacterium]